MDEVIDAARALIARNRVLHLATGGAGGPAVAPLFYVLEGAGLALCWVSDPDALHSARLATDPRVAISISAGRPAARRIHGVQLRGTAGLHPRQEQAREQYGRRFPWAVPALQAAADHRFYRFEPSWLRLVRNDAGAIRRDERDL